MLLFPITIVAFQCVDLELLQHWWSIEVEQLILNSLGEASIEISI